MQEPTSEQRQRALAIAEKMTELLGRLPSIQKGEEAAFIAELDQLQGETQALADETGIEYPPKRTEFVPLIPPAVPAMETVFANMAKALQDQQKTRPKVVILGDSIREGGVHVPGSPWINPVAEEMLRKQAERSVMDSTPVAELIAKEMASRDRIKLASMSPAERFVEVRVLRPLRRSRMRVLHRVARYVEKYA